MASTYLGFPVNPGGEEIELKQNGRVSRIDQFIRRTYGDNWYKPNQRFGPIFGGAGESGPNSSGVWPQNNVVAGPSVARGFTAPNGQYLPDFFPMTTDTGPAQYGNQWDNPRAAAASFGANSTKPGSLPSPAIMEMSAYLSSGGWPGAGGQTLEQWRQSQARSDSTPADPGWGNSSPRKKTVSSQASPANQPPAGAFGSQASVRRKILGR